MKISYTIDKSNIEIKKTALDIIFSNLMIDWFDLICFKTIKISNIKYTRLHWNILTECQDYIGCLESYNQIFRSLFSTRQWFRQSVFITATAVLNSALASSIECSSCLHSYTCGKMSILIYNKNGAICLCQGLFTFFTFFILNFKQQHFLFIQCCHYVNDVDGEVDTATFR